MRKIGTTLLMTAAAAMVAAPVAAAPAANPNTASYWSAELGLKCYKTSISDVHKWVANRDFAAVVVKGGAVDYGFGKGIWVYEDVMKGTKIYAPKNNGGQVADISWLIVCKGDGGYPTT